MALSGQMQMYNIRSVAWRVSLAGEGRGGGVILSAAKCELSHCAFYITPGAYDSHVTLKGSVCKRLRQMKPPP